MSPTTSKGTQAASLSLITSLLPILAGAFHGFHWTDDESFFLLTALGMRAGRLLYSDLPVLYGPVPLWSNFAIFEIFGATHSVSRCLLIALIFATALFSFACARRLSLSPLLSMLVPLVWVWSCAQVLYTGIHVGWYIALFVAIQGFLLTFSYSTSAWATQGVLTALIAASKPAMGVCSAYALLVVLILRMKLSFITRMTPPVLFVLLWFAILQRSGILNSSGSLPAFIQVSFWMLVLLPVPYLLGQNKLSTLFSLHDSPRKYLCIFAVLMALTVLLLYSTAFSLYGMADVLAGLVGVVWRTYLTSIPPGAYIEMSDAALIMPLVIAGTLAVFLPHRRDFAFSIAGLYWIVLQMKLGQHGVIAGWPFIYILALQKVLGSNDPEQSAHRFLPILILLFCHFLQAVPLKDYQICFATPLSNIAVMYLLSPGKRSLMPVQISPLLSNAGIILIPIVAWLWFGSYVYSIIHNPAPILPGTRLIRIDNEERAVLENLVSYIRSHKRENDCMLALTGEDSFNLWTQLPRPTGSQAAKWMEVRDSLRTPGPSCRFVVKRDMPAIDRIQVDEKSRATVPFLYVLKTEYQEIPLREWNNDLPNPVGFRLYMIEKIRQAGLS